MENLNFSNIANKYFNLSTVQKSASAGLFELIDIKAEESVLDIGCGPGNLTSKIKSITCGKVTGIDVSAGMVEEALKNYGHSGIDFHAMDVREIDYNEEFDAIFCNSTFQWFKEVEYSLNKIYNALKKGGRVAIQAPATEMYCPNFVTAIKNITSADDYLLNIFSQFISPWLFYETAHEYSKKFKEAGFDVKFSEIVECAELFPPEKVFGVFSSGAIAGYLNRDSYPVQIDSNYINKFKDKIKEEFIKQADKDGLVRLVFNRIYLLAYK